VWYFRIYDLRSPYATCLSAGGVADEWVTQLMRQGDAKVFKKFSQMKLQMKREALQKLPEGQRRPTGFCHGEGQLMGFYHGFATVGRGFGSIQARRTVSEIEKVA
jgi:hypothetical protein